MLKELLKNLVSPSTKNCAMAINILQQIPIEFSYFFEMSKRFVFIDYRKLTNFHLFIFQKKGIVHKLYDWSIITNIVEKISRKVHIDDRIKGTSKMYNYK